MAAVPADLPIRLDATPMGRPLYRRTDSRTRRAHASRRGLGRAVRAIESSPVRPPDGRRPADRRSARTARSSAAIAGRCSSGLCAPRSMAMSCGATTDWRIIVSAGRAASSIRSVPWLRARTASRPALVDAALASAGRPAGGRRRVRFARSCSRRGCAPAVSRRAAAVPNVPPRRRVAASTGSRNRAGARRVRDSRT